jgi:hypothetical protein
MVARTARTARTAKPQTHENTPDHTPDVVDIDTAQATPEPTEEEPTPTMTAVTEESEAAAQGATDATDDEGTDENDENGSEEEEEDGEEEANTPTDLSQHPNSTVREVWATLQSNTAAYQAAINELTEKRPPTPDELTSLIDASDEEDIVSLRDALAEIRAQVAQRKKELDEAMLATLTIASPDEAQQLTDRVNGKKLLVTEALDLLVKLATVLKFADVPVAVAEFRRSMPNLSGNASSSNLKSVNAGKRFLARIAAITVTKPDGVVMTYKTIGQASVYAQNASTEEIGEAWKHEARVKKWQDIKEPVTFELREVTYTITPLPH